MRRLSVKFFSFFFLRFCFVFLRIVLALRKKSCANDGRYAPFLLTYHVASKQFDSVRVVPSLPVPCIFVCTDHHGFFRELSASISVSVPCNDMLDFQQYPWLRRKITQKMCDYANGIENITLLRRCTAWLRDQLRKKWMPSRNQICAVRYGLAVAIYH